MEVYLDNAATTKAFDEVTELMVKVLKEDFGNPSSLHKKGLDAEHYIRDAKDNIAKCLKCEPKEIYFTSGATESNNMAIVGAAKAKARLGKHIITSSIEHASVKNVTEALKKEGYEITYLPVDEKGIVRLDELQKSIREDTVLVSIMAVNNEVGAVQPIEEIAKIVKGADHEIIFHVDGVQAFGKIPIYPKRLGVDLLSASGHKFHGPKGTGFLFIRDGVRILPLIYGGNQQSGMRSGTENVPGIAGLGLAAKMVCETMDETSARMGKLKAEFLDMIMRLPDVKNNSGDAPHIVSITFDGVRSEVLLHALEDKGIYVSSGSACSSNKPELSGTLLNMGLSRDQAESTVRFTLSRYTTLDELKYTAATVESLFMQLRRYIRR
ncbi:MAG: cysteine desulfurase [Lachnospiraceae bacterium]|nr:cysteine desulfurase [Lachnospiraceae bacterium]